MHDNSKIWAFFAYLFLIAGFALAYFLRRHDRFAMYHAKQSLVLFMACIAVWIAARILGFIPFLGVLISAMMWLTLLALWVIGLIYALSGQEKPLPIIGEFAHRINL